MSAAAEPAGGAAVDADAEEALAVAGAIGGAGGEVVDGSRSRPWASNSGDLFGVDGAGVPGQGVGDGAGDGRGGAWPPIRRRRATPSTRPASRQSPEPIGLTASISGGKTRKNRPSAWTSAASGPSVTTSEPDAVAAPGAEQVEDLVVVGIVLAEVTGDLRAVELDDVRPEAPDHSPGAGRRCRGRPAIGASGPSRSGRGTGRRSPRDGLEPERVIASTSPPETARSTRRSRSSASVGRDLGVGVEEGGLLGGRVGPDGQDRPGRRLRSGQRADRTPRRRAAGSRSGRRSGPPRKVAGRADRPRRFRARATLFPLPPTTSETAWPRIDWPGVHGGTTRVLSRHGLRVTQRIIVGGSRRRFGERSGRQPARRTTDGDGSPRWRRHRRTKPIRIEDRTTPERSSGPAGGQAIGLLLSPDLDPESNAPARKNADEPADRAGCGASGRSHILGGSPRLRGVASSPNDPAGAPARCRRPADRWPDSCRTRWPSSPASAS